MHCLKILPCSSFGENNAHKAQSMKISDHVEQDTDKIYTSFEGCYYGAGHFNHQPLDYLINFTLGEMQKENISNITTKQTSQ